MRVRRGEVATSVSIMLLKALPRDQTGTSKFPTDLAVLFGELPSMLSSITHPSLPYVLHCPSRLCSSFHFPSCNQNKGKPLWLPALKTFSLAFLFPLCESLSGTSSEVYLQSDLSVFEVVSLLVSPCSDTARPPQQGLRSSRSPGDLSCQAILSCAVETEEGRGEKDVPG